MELKFEYYHFSGGMDNFHLFKDGGSIIGDKYMTLGVLDLRRVRLKIDMSLPSCPYLLAPN